MTAGPLFLLACLVGWLRCSAQCSGCCESQSQGPTLPSHCAENLGTRLGFVTSPPGARHLSPRNSNAECYPAQGPLWSWAYATQEKSLGHAAGRQLWKHHCLGHFKVDQTGLETGLQISQRQGIRLELQGFKVRAEEVKNQNGKAALLGAAGLKGCQQSLEWGPELE